MARRFNCIIIIFINCRIADKVIKMAKLNNLERKKTSVRELPVLMRRALKIRGQKPCSSYQKGESTERWFFTYYTFARGVGIDKGLENRFRGILGEYFGKPRIYNSREKLPKYAERALKIVNNNGGSFVASGQELFSRRVNEKTIDIASGCGASYTIVRIRDLGSLEADFYCI